MKWKQLTSNQVLNGVGFYISYNRNTAAGHLAGSLTNLANKVAPLAGLESTFDDGEETALCIKKGGDQEWLILKGDFRKEYELAFPSIKKCRAVYEKHKESARSQWSTDN